ncbi:MAG: hypothetical protein U1E22_09750, partial [Coriobacteriia bacterium]|nr:hypothetical protein [Coriobacteriia bacterium]
RSYLESDGLIGAHSGPLGKGNIEDLLAGRLLEQPVDPIVLIRALAVQGGVSFQTRMAVIVTLYELAGAHRAANGNPT